MGPIDVLTTLRKLLALLHKAREAALWERESLKKFNMPDGLVELAATRNAFHRECESMQQLLLGHLRLACEEHGLPTPSVAGLARRLPSEQADELRRSYEEVRVAALALTQEELINQELTRRALACVKGYLAVLAPRNPYDRRGVQPARAVSTVSARL